LPLLDEAAVVSRKVPVILDRGRRIANRRYVRGQRDGERGDIRRIEVARWRKDRIRRDRSGRLATRGLLDTIELLGTASNPGNAPGALPDPAPEQDTVPARAPIANRDRT